MLRTRSSLESRERDSQTHLPFFVRTVDQTAGNPPVMHCKFGKRNQSAVRLSNKSLPMCFSLEIAASGRRLSAISRSTEQRHFSFFLLFFFVFSSSFHSILAKRSLRRISFSRVNSNINILIQFSFRLVKRFYMNDMCLRIQINIINKLQGR